MFRPLSFLLSLGCVLLPPLSAGAQQPPGQQPPSAASFAPPDDGKDPLPAAPGDYVLDNTGFFPVESAGELKRELADFQNITGVKLYVAIFTYLLDESADARARRCLETWLKPGEAGVVMAHDKGSGRLSFAGSTDPRLPRAADLVRAFGQADAALKALPAGAPTHERLGASARRLMEVLREWKTTGAVAGASSGSPADGSGVAKAPESAPAAGAEAAASGVSGIPLDKRPDVFLLDEAGVFSGSAASALEDRLAAFHRENDVDLFVVTMIYPPEVAGGFPADALREVWLGERPGGVIIYDRSRPKDLAIAGAAPGGPWITPLRLESIHRDARAAAASEGGESPSAGILAAVDVVMEKYLAEGVPVRDAAKRVAPSFPPGVLPLVALAFCVGAAGLYFFHRWQEAADRRRAAVRLLPDVEVPRRLGAQHGGGVVVEIRAK